MGLIGTNSHQRLRDIILYYVAHNTFIESRVRFLINTDDLFYLLSHNREKQVIEFKHETRSNTIAIVGIIIQELLENETELK